MVMHVQKLKYHIQTSGRSLHAQEIDFNDIRTTLQALLAIQDNANPLCIPMPMMKPLIRHNRRICQAGFVTQLIVNKESGWTKTENPLAGVGYRRITDLVEEAVLQEFGHFSEGCARAWRRCIKEVTKMSPCIMNTLKHDGTLPIVGNNIFRIQMYQYLMNPLLMILNGVGTSHSQEEKQEGAWTE